MDYTSTEALDLSLPRKRRSISSSPPTPAVDPTIHDDNEDSIIESATKRPKHSSSSNVTPTNLNNMNTSDVCSIKRSCGNVSVCLHDEKLWRDFLMLGTEMIINRTGRRMFPHVVLTIQGLDPQSYYSVSMEIVPADNRRYKYVHNQWMPIGAEDPGRDIHPVTHPDSPSTGTHWLRNKISFSKVRLTNSKESSAKENADGNILLLSMHKYMVVIMVKKEGQHFPDSGMKFEFHESAFFAVTAYQNNKITQLKIQNNPFAKAFREAQSTSVEPNKPSTKSRGLKDGCHDSKSKSFKTSGACSTITESAGVPQTTVNFPQGMFGGLQMAAFDQIYRAAFGTRNLQSPSYFPWLAMGSPFSYPFWQKGSNNSGSSLSIDLNTMRLPLEMSQSPSYFRPSTLQNEGLCAERNSPPLDEQQSQSVK